MLYYNDEKGDYILAYTAEVSDNSISECDIPFALCVMGLDLLFKKILESMYHTRLERISLHTGNLVFTFTHKVLILPKRPPLGPREEEIHRITKGPL